jgi:uncharacterized membrane protein
MEPKRSKYDTNPLEQDVARRADESFGQYGSGTQEISGPTRPMSQPAANTSRTAGEGEAPTRRIDSDKVTSYPSVFVPPPPRTSATYAPPRVTPSEIYQPPPSAPPNIYQPPPLPLRPGLNTVQGLGMQERWALMLPYLPFWLGIAASVIELILVPRSEARIRFHASQAMVLQIGMTALTMLLGGVALVSHTFTGVSLFRFACFVFLIIAMVKVWKGKPFVIGALEQPRKWLDEKLGPRK